MSGHDPVRLTKATKLTVKGVSAPGVLTITNSVLSWKPNDPAAAEAMTVILSSITGRQQVKGRPFMRLLTATTPLIFEFDSEQDRDAAMDLLASLLPSQQNPAAPTASDKHLPPKDVRLNLLSTNRDLAHLYNSLVRPGTISEEEFWRSHKSVLEAALRSQPAASTSAPVGGPAMRPGLPNTMPSLGESLDGRSDKLHFSLTPEIIAQIFAAKPAVEKAYRANVPSNMSDQAFWEKYCKHQLALKRRRHLLMLGKPADNVEDENREMFEETTDVAAATAARVKVRRIDPSLNLAADIDDGFSEGFGLSHNPAKEPENLLGLGGDIVRDLNRHADVVLRGLPSSTGKGDPAALALKLSEMRKADSGTQHLSQAEPPEDELAQLQRQRGRTLDDLEQPRETHWSKLQLSDHSRYFDQVKQDAGSSLKHVDPGTSLQLLQRVNPDVISMPVIPPRDAYEVLQDLSKGASTGHQLDSYGQPTRSPAAVLSQQKLDECRAMVLTVNELLRHFWSCFPLNTPARSAKVEKLKAALGATYDKLQEMLQAAQRMEQGRHVAQLLRPAEEALNTAFIKYDQDVAGKGAAGRWAAAS